MSETLNALYAEMEQAFAHLNKRLVFGDGNISSRVMLIGEAPGAQEEAQGKPFVGKAGKNLNEFLSMTGIDRATLFVSNAVKFRPTRLSPAGNIVNRTPTNSEVQAFKPYLLREIAIVSPEIVVTLGNTPLRALLGNSVTIGAVHGQMLENHIFPLYHPASIIYNPTLKQTWYEDIVKLAIYLKI